MDILSLWQRPAVRWTGVALGVLVVSGVLVDHFAPRPVRKVEETRMVASSEQHAESRTDTEARQAVTQLAQAFQQLQSRQDTQERRQADTQTRTSETTYRGDALAIAALLRGNQAPAAAPVVNVLPAQPGTAPSPERPTVTSPSPVEVVVRTSEAIDKSRTETGSTTETSAKSEAHSETHADTETKTVEVAKADAQTETRTETKVETAKGSPRPGDSGGGRLGVGILSSAQPFASYDLAKAPLGPRFLHLGEAGAGVFITRSFSGSSGFDGGPQVNLSKGRVFGMLGYQLREKAPVLGVGIHF